MPAGVILILVLNASVAVAVAGDPVALDEEPQVRMLRRAESTTSATASCNKLMMFVNVWASANGMTSDTRLATAASGLRQYPKQSAAIRPLEDLMPHQSIVWAERDQLEVIRLRSWPLISLADVGLAVELLQYTLDILAHADERSQAIELAAAASVVRLCSRDVSSRAIPHLVTMAGRVVSEEETSLVRYEVHFDEAEATTPQFEAITSVAVVCRPSDVNVVLFLERLANIPKASRWDPRARIAAQNALRQIARNGSVN